MSRGEYWSDWRTPDEWLRLVQRILVIPGGGPWVDPCVPESDDGPGGVHERVRAFGGLPERRVSSDRKADTRPWYVNPPGDRSGRVMRSWIRDVCQASDWDRPTLFMAYNVSALAIDMADREPMIAIPHKRIAFIGRDGRPAKAPMHHNALLLFGGSADVGCRFVDALKFTCNIWDRT